MNILSLQDDTTGEYFKNTYEELLRLSSTFPPINTPPNIQECLSSWNFYRAVALARQHNMPFEIISQLQECAIYQYLFDYKNPLGSQALIQEYGLTATDMDRIDRLIRDEKVYPFFSYDKATAAAALRENGTLGGIGYKTYSPETLTPTALIWIILVCGIIVAVFIILRLLGII